MLTAFIDRITGLLRPANRQASLDRSTDHPGAAAEMVRPFPHRATLISPVTIGLLEALGVRHATAVAWVPHISQAAHRYEIDVSPRRLAAWLATIAHESARLTLLVERLNYTAQGLANTWPTRYAVDPRAKPPVPNSTAHRIAGNAEQIANQTYAGRLGNGAVGSGDGWHYRGRGLIQITGRANYAAIGAELGLDLLAKPQLLEQPFLSALSAGQWWYRNGCNALADTGDLASVTRVVNGALTGLDDRIRLYAAALAYLGTNPTQPPKTERSA
jgi:putative chitinase